MASCNGLNLILLVIMSSVSCMYWTSARDTLKSGDTLDSLSYLDSENGKFSLGFYVNFDNSYQLGLWWLGRSNLLWIIPNRCTPSLYPTSSTGGLLLTLDQNKTLRITHKGGDHTVVLASADPQTTSTGSSSSSASVVATLLDSGNFVLQEVNSDDGSTKRVFWQSFDCPTDTLFPGMKLGFNKRNGHTWSLSSEDWSLDWDPKGRRLNISRAGVVHWSSGVFRDGRFEFISPDDVSGVPMFNFSVVSNGSTQDYFTFYTHVNRSEISPWLLNKNGRLSAYGGHDIARADHCYGNNTDQGCQLFPTSTTEVQEKRPSADIAPADTKKQRIRIGTSIAAALLALVLCIGCYLRQRKIKLLLPVPGENKTKIEKELLDLMASHRSSDNVSGLHEKMRHDLRVFSYESVMTATGNFSKENKVGEGGFGPVYKGKFMSGREIAVKRLSRYSGQGTLEFKNEVKLISELQHTKLVRLLGFCIYGEERMLIYEYMPNRSLDYFIFDSTRGQLLDWKKRFDIIGGIAQGLLYLHKYSRLRVIHRDLKASNILLDENMNPKISDFGLARIFMDNERQANTNRVVGTYGYMSPEYAMEGLFSTKSDVYSFGVLMLEIISGRKNSSFYNDDSVLNIVGYAWELWKEGAGLKLMDPTLGESCIRDELLRCIHVGLLCVEENAADRPTMSDVISMLTNESMPLALPTKPAFFTARKVVGAGIGGEEPEIISINGFSNSEFDGR